MGTVGGSAILTLRKESMNNTWFICRAKVTTILIAVTCFASTLGGKAAKV